MRAKNGQQYRIAETLTFVVVDYILRYPLSLRR